MQGEHPIPDENHFNPGGPTTPPQTPAASIPTSQLPFPLTFFLTAAQRAAVLRKLNTLHEDRVTALLIALEQTSPIQ